jgi:hypothetical protein
VYVLLDAGADFPVGAPLSGPAEEEGSVRTDAADSPPAPAARAAAGQDAPPRRPLRQWLLLTRRNADILTRARLTLAILVGAPVMVLLMFLVLFRPGPFDPGNPNPEATGQVLFWVAFPALPRPENGPLPVRPPSAGEWGCAGDATVRSVKASVTALSRRGAVPGPRTRAWESRRSYTNWTMSRSARLPASSVGTLCSERMRMSASLTTSNSSLSVWTVELAAGNRVSGAPEMGGHDPSGGLTVTALDGVDNGAMLFGTLDALVVRLAHGHQDRLAEGFHNHADCRVVRRYRESEVEPERYRDAIGTLVPRSFLFVTQGSQLPYVGLSRLFAD